MTAPGVNSALLSSAGGGYVAVEMVFIQFAGFTFGKSASAYATPWNGYPGNNNSFLMGGADYVTGVNNIQYTAQFGNGVSATIGLDDPTVFGRTSVLNLGVAATTAGLALNASPTAAGANAYGGTHVPDIVGHFPALGFEIDRLEIGARPFGQRSAALEHLLLQCLGEAARRLAQVTGKEAHH